MRAQVKADYPGFKPGEISQKMENYGENFLSKIRHHIQKSGKLKAIWQKSRVERQMVVHRKSNIQGSCIGEGSDSDAVDPNDTQRNSENGCATLH